MISEQNAKNRENITKAAVDFNEDYCNEMSSLAFGELIDSMELLVDRALATQREEFISFLYDLKDSYDDRSMFRKRETVEEIIRLFDESEKKEDHGTL